MHGHDDGVECHNFDWTTEDELEVENFHPSPKCLTDPNEETIRDFGEESFLTRFFLNEFIFMDIAHQFAEN